MTNGNRELSKKDIKILRAMSRGKCMFNKNGEFCDQDVLYKKSTGEIVTVAEQAHILPHAADFARGGSGKRDDGYENRLLLCRNHHAVFDRDPEKYTLEVADQMRLVAEIKYFSEEVANLSIGEVSNDEGKLLVKYYFFIEKIAYLRRLFDGYIPETERKKFIDELRKSSVLLWHLIKNSNGSDRLDIVKLDKFLELLELHDEPSIAYMTLKRISESGDRISDFESIIEGIVVVHNKYYGPVSQVLRTLTSIDVPEEFCKDIIKLIFEQPVIDHPFVKQDSIKLLDKLSKSDNKDFIIEKINDILSSGKTEENVNVGGTALSLTLQASDLKNHVFGEVMDLLGGLVGEPTATESARDYLCILIDSEIEKDIDPESSMNGYVNDNYIWHDSSDFPRTELKYEYDKLERYTGEMRRGLELLHNSGEYKLVQDMLDFLINKKSLTYIALCLKFLQSHTSEYIDYVKKVVFDKGLWDIWFIRDWYLQKLIGEYFQVNTSSLGEFVGVAMEQNEEICSQLLVAIPELKRTSEVQSWLDEYSSKSGKDPGVRKHVSVTSSSGSISTSFFNEKSDDEIEKLLEESGGMDRTADLYGFMTELRSYIGDNHKKAYDLLQKLEVKSLHTQVVSALTGVVCKDIEESNGSLSELIANVNKLYVTIADSDGGRVEILRLLTSALRSDDTQNLNERDPDEFGKLLDNVLEMSENSDPVRDSKTTVAGEETFDSAISSAYNSVRGLAIEVLLILCSNYPNIQVLKQRIEEMSDDTSIAVRSYLFYNISRLTRNNYETCNRLVQKYAHERILGIDYGLISYFRHMPADKMQDISEMFRHMLVNNENKQIQKYLGMLLGDILCLGIAGFDDITNDFISKRIGTSVALGGCTRNIIHRIVETLKADTKDGKILEYRSCLKDVLQAHNEDLDEDSMMPEIGFFIRRGDLSYEAFLSLNAAGVIEYLIGIEPFSVQFHQYLVEYIEHMICDDFVNVDLGVEVLFSQLTKHAPIYSDHLISDGIAKVCAVCFDRESEVTFETMKKVIRLFDKGLEVGYEDFYDLYDQYFVTGVIDVSKYLT